MELLISSVAPALCCQSLLQETVLFGSCEMQQCSWYGCTLHLHSNCCVTHKSKLLSAIATAVPLAVPHCCPANWQSAAAAVSHQAGDSCLMDRPLSRR